MKDYKNNNAIDEFIKNHNVSYIEALETITGKTISEFIHGENK